MNQAVKFPSGALSFARCAGAGMALDVLGAPYVIKAHAAETGGAFCCIECTIPAGTGVPPHTHTREDEVFYVLAGEIVVDSVDSPGPLRLAAGSFFFAPRGRQHAFRNEANGEARLLVFGLPGAGLEQMFREMDAAGREAGGGPEMATIGGIAARAGVVIAA